MLLLASTAFYMTFIPKYVLIIYFTIAVDYVAGLLIERSAGRRRTYFLVASLVATRSWSRGRSNARRTLCTS